jgi:hypothetical protein
LKKQFAMKLSIPQTDVRVISVKKITDSSLINFRVEMRLANETSTDDAKTHILSNTSGLELAIKRDITQGGLAATVVSSVHIEKDSIMKVSNGVIHDEGGGLGAVAIAAIVIGCCVVLGAIVFAVYYFGGAQGEKGDNMETAPLNSNGFQQQFVGGNIQPPRVYYAPNPYWQ